MSKANFRSIHDQTYLTQATPLGLQPLARNRLVPFTYTDGWIVQKAAQAPGDAHQLRRARNLPCNPAQVNRAAFVNPYKQPDKVAYLGNSLTWPQFTNSLHPSMIEFVDRHLASPGVRFLGRSLLYPVFPADQLLFTKLSGG